MNGNDLKTLFLDTVRDPAQATRDLINRNIPIQALWMVLALISIIASLLASGLIRLVPLVDAELSEMISATPTYSQPILFALIQLFRVVATVFAVFWAGVGFGGKGRFEDVLAAMVLIQGVAFVVLFVSGLAGALIPFAGAFVLLAAFGWVIWATVVAVDVAHHFGNRLKSAFVLVVSLLVVSMVFATLLSLILTPA